MKIKERKSEFKEGNGLLMACMFLERCYGITQSMAKQLKLLPKIKILVGMLFVESPFIRQKNYIFTNLIIVSEY